MWSEAVWNARPRHGGRRTSTIDTAGRGVKRYRIFRRGESCGSQSSFLVLSSGLCRLRPAPNPCPVPKANKALRGQRVTRVRPVPRVPKANRGFRDRKGRKEQWETRVPPGLRVLKGIKAFQDHRGLKVRRETKGRQDSQGRRRKQACRVRKVPQARKEKRAQGHKARRVMQVRPGRLDHKAHPARRLQRRQQAFTS
jgi:hypothetical protein